MSKKGPAGARGNPVWDCCPPLTAQIHAVLNDATLYPMRPVVSRMGDGRVYFLYPGMYGRALTRQQAKKLVPLFADGGVGSWDVEVTDMLRSAIRALDQLNGQADG